jgi:hypothetical protein
MTTHVVKRGENLTAIARKYGIPDWRTIYNHPNNRAFRIRRPDPNLILPGDQLFIPDQTPWRVAPSPSQVPKNVGHIQAVQADQLLAGAPHPPQMVYPELAPHNKQGLGQQKQAWWDNALAAGATQAEAAIIVAQLMQEGGRDPTKDTLGGAANYSDLNLNRDLLTQFGGVSPQDLSALNVNTPDGRQKTVKAALTAMRRMGVERYLHHVRAGATGYNHPDQRISHNPRVMNDDTRRFGRNIANAARKLLADYNDNPLSMSNDVRYAGNIPWI